MYIFLSFILNLYGDEEAASLPYLPRQPFPPMLKPQKKRKLMFPLNPFVRKLRPIKILQSLHQKHQWQLSKP